MTAHGVLRKSIDCQPLNFEGLPGQLPNFFSEKKTQWSFEKFENRQKDSCRKKRQESWKRWQKMSELHCFQHCKVYEQGRGPVWMPRL